MGFRFVAKFGNTRVLTFRLRRFQDKQPWDVSGATQILLECNDPTDTPIDPIPLIDTASGANWAQGIVVVTIGAGDVTSIIGTWHAGLTLFIGGEEVTADDGVIDVELRPGFPYP